MSETTYACAMSNPDGHVTGPMSWNACEGGGNEGAKQLLTEPMGVNAYVWREHERARKILTGI